MENEFFSLKNENESYVFRLFIAGNSVLSVNAIKNIKKFCEENLNERYDLKVIDLYKQPILSREHQIFATPTLVKMSPLPVRRLIGNLSNTDFLKKQLDL